MNRNISFGLDLSRYRISYEKDLNPAQLEAVMFGEGPALIVAGAGSGKTRTLTYRVSRLVEEGVSPEQILLLSFTRKAAQEMLERSARLLDHRCSRVAGGTFHSFANTVLRRHAGKIGCDNRFSILDRSDAESLISMFRKEISRAENHRRIPTRRTLANIYSKAANTCRSVEDIVHENYFHLAEEMEAIESIHRLYQRYKAGHMFFDYDDLLVKLEALLESHEDVCEKLGDHYRYIMVDEYQDTNQIQARILHLLAGRHRNLMVVGDDSQSIYAFRGADFENIITFPERFPGTRIIKLEQNYRSTQPILDLTNAILSRAGRKFTKFLFTENSGGGAPVLVHTAGEHGQSLFVMEKIKALQKSGTPLNRIAVLFRSGFHSFDLEIELNREEIPFVKVGGFKFMESAHIKDVLAHLRVVINPLDRIGWHRILNLLDRVGPKTAQTVYESVRAKRDIPSGLDAVKWSPAQKKAVEPLYRLFADLNYGTMTVARLGERIIEYYTPVLKRTFDDYPRRVKDLEQLVAIMQRYHDPDRFLTDMALEPPSSAINNALSIGEDPARRLVLSTVHSAKGLEWDTVFVIWALDGRFPSVQAMQKPADIEEELRLMYVAATRARNNLYFTCPGQVYDRSTRMLLSRPSRFIDGISERILERWYLPDTDWMEGG